MDKRKGETDLRGASSSAPKPIESELAVILMTRFGVTATAPPRSDGEKCEMVEKEFPFLAMRHHRWEEAGKLLLVGGEIFDPMCSLPSGEVYELKVGRNLELEMVKSESIEPSNYGVERGHHLVSQFPEEGLPYTDGEYFLVPGFDENEYHLAPKMVPGELEPHLIAYLLDKHQKLCLQFIHGGLFPLYKDPNRVGQSKVGGICYGRKSESAELEPFLFLSIFSLERHPDLRLPLSDHGGVLVREFLSVTGVKKHKVDNVPEPVGRFHIFGGSFTYL